MLKPGCLPLLLALGAAGCGGEPPPPKAPAPALFDPLVEQKVTVAAALGAAQAQRDAGIRRQGEPPEDESPAGARR